MNIVIDPQSFVHSYKPWLYHHEPLEVMQIPQNGMSHPENSVQNNRKIHIIIKVFYQITFMTEIIQEHNFKSEVHVIAIPNEKYI
jgi:hypothetical protein